MLVLPAVAATLDRLEISFELLECDPALADTADFCANYGVDPNDVANTILVSSKRPVGVDAICVALATTRLDVNRAVRDQLGVKKLSFASAERTRELTGMELGGVTPLGVPTSLPILIDERVILRDRVIVGGGNRSWKVALPGRALTQLDGARVIETLARSRE